MKQIELTSGYFAFVDDQDFEFLNQWDWWANAYNGCNYAERSVKIDGKKYTIKMHRLLIGVTDSKILVDHIDGNGLNNQRSNLRVCSKSQNGMNRGTIKRTRLTKFKGVQFHKAAKKWVAEIVSDKKKYYLGLFVNEEDAARAYDSKAKELHGEFANVNFK